MQMTIKEMHKQRAWMQNTHHTNKSLTQDTHCVTVYVSPQSAHKHTHTFKLHVKYNTISMQATALQDQCVHLLLFVTTLPSFAAAVLPVGGRDGVDRGALFAGGMGRVGRVGQACPRLACIVIELHEAEDQVCGHKLKFIRWVRDHVSVRRTNVNKMLNFDYPC